MATPEAIQNTSEIIESRSENHQILAVLSAFGGITNALIRAGEQAARGSSDYRATCQEIRDSHLKVVIELIPDDQSEEVLRDTKFLLAELEEKCYGCFLLRELSLKTKDDLVSYGERLSTLIVSRYLCSKGIPTLAMDSRKYIVTDGQFTCARVDRKATEKRLSELDRSANVIIAPGFIGANHDGETTTLGRGGSDYSAALIANAFDAVQMEKWTDVPGMMTTDPRVVPSAKSINKLSYWEAMELCHFGAKVIYPPTIHPLMEKRIPLVIKNTFEPDTLGTVISSEANGVDQPVKGLSSISNMSLLTLSGSGMLGIPGFSRRLFTALSYNNINVALITQASSEHTITVGVEDEVVSQALKLIQNEFEYDLERGTLDEIHVENDLSIIALVGDHMKKHTGISGRAFHTLGRNGVNIRAIAQGSSERNISIVINSSDVHKGLSALHETFFDGEVKKINVFAAGVGNVGSTLLDQLKSQEKKLLEESNIKINVVGLSNSKKMIVKSDGINLDSWKDELQQSELKTSPENIQISLLEMNLSNAVFVDNTASDLLPESYLKMLQKSIAIVASNKVAASSDFNNYKKLKSASLKFSAPYLFETNVGAGLPIIETINNLVMSGDNVTDIQAILSGSLNFVFNNYREGVSFRDVVDQAMKEGYTEPDPRIDLSGKDVQRKILILARESGIEMEMNDIVNVPFLPAEIMDGEVDGFLARLDGAEDLMSSLIAKAKNNKSRLKYTASLSNGKAEVGLKEIPEGHPFYDISGSDNIVAIKTTRYQQQPLIIRGAGAGAEVTAMGVFADLIRLANR